MSQLVTKPAKWHVRPAKTQIGLGIRPVWSESALSACRKLGSLATHWAHSEGSDQTGWMPRLCWVFAGCTVLLLVLSWGGSNFEWQLAALFCTWKLTTTHVFCCLINDTEFRAFRANFHSGHHNVVWTGSISDDSARSCSYRKWGPARDSFLTNRQTCYICDMH